MSSRWFLARLGPDAPGMSHSRHSSLSGLSSSLGGGLRQSRALRSQGRFQTPPQSACEQEGAAAPAPGRWAGPPQLEGWGRRTVVCQGPGSCAGCISELSRVLPKAWALLCLLLCFILLGWPWSRSPGQDPSLTPLAAPRCEDVMWETPSGCPLGRAQSRPLLPMARSPLRGQKLHKSN